VDRAEKREVVTALHDAIAKSRVVVVAHYAGLTVGDMTKFRREMRSMGGRVKVAKNRLVKLAVEGTDAKGISDLLKGPTCVAFSDDPVAAPKVAVIARRPPRQVNRPPSGACEQDRPHVERARCAACPRVRGLWQKGSSVTAGHIT